MQLLEFAQQLELFIYEITKPFESPVFSLRFLDSFIEFSGFLVDFVFSCIFRERHGASRRFSRSGFVRF